MISEIFYRNGGVDPFPIPESEDFIHVHGKDPVALYSPFLFGEVSGYYYWKSKDRAFRVELCVDKIRVFEIDVYDQRPPASELEPSVYADLTSMTYYQAIKIYDDPERYIVIEDEGCS